MFAGGSSIYIFCFSTISVLNILFSIIYEKKTFFESVFQKSELQINCILMYLTMFAMHEQPKRWEEQFYMEPLPAIILCATLWIALKNRNKYKILKYIPVYIISFSPAINSIISGYIGHSDRHNSEFFFDISDYFLALVELIIFSHFFYQLINSYYIKKLLIFLNISFTAFFLQLRFSDKKFYQQISNDTESTVYTIEGAILLLLRIFNFAKLFKKIPLMALKKQPPFLASIALLFFLTRTLPYYILETHFTQNHSDFFVRLYSIFYIFYIIFFR